MRGDVVDERLGIEALPLQAPLHIGQGEHDRIDFALRDQIAQFVERHVVSSSCNRMPLPGPPGQRYVLGLKNPWSTRRWRSSADTSTLAGVSRKTFSAMR